MKRCANKRRRRVAWTSHSSGFANWLGNFTCGKSECCVLFNAFLSILITEIWVIEIQNKIHYLSLSFIDGELFQFGCDCLSSGSIDFLEQTIKFNRICKIIAMSHLLYEQISTNLCEHFMSYGLTISWILIYIYIHLVGATMSISQRKCARYHPTDANVQVIQTRNHNIEAKSY